MIDFDTDFVRFYLLVDGLLILGRIFCQLLHLRFVCVLLAVLMGRGLWGLVRRSLLLYRSWSCSRRWGRVLSILSFMGLYNYHYHLIISYLSILLSMILSSNPIIHLILLSISIRCLSYEAIFLFLLYLRLILICAPLLGFASLDWCLCLFF